MKDRIYADQMFRELGQINSNPSGVSVECTMPDSAQRKIVREFTRAKIAASSMLNISTSREQLEHQANLRCL